MFCFGLAVFPVFRGDVGYGATGIESELHGVRYREILDRAGRIEHQRLRGVRGWQIFQRDKGGRGEHTHTGAHMH